MSFAWLDYPSNFSCALFQVTSWIWPVQEMLNVIMQNQDVVQDMEENMLATLHGLECSMMTKSTF